jgi:hypothetical protein
MRGMTMFFNHSIEASKTRTSEKNRLLESNRVDVGNRIKERREEILREQDVQPTKIELGYKKSNSRLLFEQRLQKAYEMEKALKENFAQIVGDVVLESMWIDSDKKDKYAASIVATSKNLVLEMFSTGQLTVQAISENKAQAVRVLFEKAKDKASDDDDLDEDGKKKLKKKKGEWSDGEDEHKVDDFEDDSDDDSDDSDDDSDDSDDSDDDSEDDSDDSTDDKPAPAPKKKKKKKKKTSDASNTVSDLNKYKNPNANIEADDTGASVDYKKREDQKNIERSALAFKAIVAKTKEHVMDTIAAEKEIAEKNQTRNKELQEGTRIVRPRRESPTLWRAININVAKVINESGDEPDTEKVIAESLAIYTFLEAMNVMNLISVSPDKVAGLCKMIK